MDAKRKSTFVITHTNQDFVSTWHFHDCFIIFLHFRFFFFFLIVCYHCLLTIDHVFLHIFIINSRKETKSTARFSRICLLEENVWRAQRWSSVCEHDWTTSTSESSLGLFRADTREWTYEEVSRGGAWTLDGSLWDSTFVRARFNSRGKSVLIYLTC